MHGPIHFLLLFSVSLPSYFLTFPLCCPFPPSSFPPWLEQFFCHVQPGLTLCTCGPCCCPGCRTQKGPELCLILHGCLLKFLMICDQGLLCFHFAPGPVKYTVGGVCLPVGASPVSLTPGTGGAFSRLVSWGYYPLGPGHPPSSLFSSSSTCLGSV